MSLVSWIAQTDVINYIRKVLTQTEAQLEAELEKMRWRTHPLYKSNTKVQLEAECKQLKIPVTSSLAKHQLTALIVKKKSEPLPPELPHTKLYSGDLVAIPTSIAAINHLTIPVLRAILKHHKIPSIGIKENLVMRVFLLRHNRTIAITSREEKQIKYLINLVYKVILGKQKLHITSHVYRRRTYTLQSNSSKFVAIPSHVVVEDDLHKRLFEPLLTWLESISRARKQYTSI